MVTEASGNGCIITAMTTAGAKQMQQEASTVIVSKHHDAAIQA